MALQNLCKLGMALFVALGEVEHQPIRLGVLLRETQVGAAPGLEPLQRAVGATRCCFRCHGEARESDEALPLWTPLAEIPYDEMWVDDSIWLPWMLEGKRFAGRFLFDGDALLDEESCVLSEAG
jgi:hypothetical protein